MARPGGLLKVSVFTMVEAEEAVAALIERVFRQTPSLYTAEETLISEVTVFCARAGAWSPRRRAELVRGLRRIRAAGLAVGPTRIRARRLPPRDWAESWKRHFKPLSIGRTLLVKPSWSRVKPAPGQAVVVLDPGLSFGTGQHPTTAFCLQQVAKLAPKAGERPGSLLDIGTGSGILAIAAAKLGYDFVRAFDFDPAAVRIAVRNARINQVNRLLRIERRDLTRLPLQSQRRYQVVCANLLANLLIAQARRITHQLCAGGHLVLAGVLRAEFPAVCAAYRGEGLKLVAQKVEKEWQSSAWLKPGAAA